MEHLFLQSQPRFLRIILILFVFFPFHLLPQLSIQTPPNSLYIKYTSSNTHNSSTLHSRLKMRALSSNCWVIDLHRSWNSANQIPTSTLAYLQNTSSFSRAFHRTPCRRSRISASIHSPGIRRPRTWSAKKNGLVSMDSASSSQSENALHELELFLELVPLRMRDQLFKHAEIRDLIEVVMDLGRKPIARFPSGDWMISESPVNVEDLQHAISKVGEFSDDNRSGIDGSLHRISAIRNRKKQTIGLTCRVGRSISGSAEIVRDLVEGGGSILVIGPPGVGKTTLIREIARMLADELKKRVVIVDTSNEIGGDGDIPHSGIGRARRMQVPNVNMQHNVMIEAVENHMPETIIIDEIGTELEALAASTIAQRGVQLVGTAHGVTVENILKNPHLQILVGGIESVTLGDEEARKRKVQKTILERKGPPTFTCAVEMISRTRCHVHRRLDETVDLLLAGKSPPFEIRCMDTETCNAVKPPPPSPKLNLVESSVHANGEEKMEKSTLVEEKEEYSSYSKKTKTKRIKKTSSHPVYVYTYKILEADVQQVAKVMGLENEIDITVDITTANAILASASELKQNPWIRGVAKFHQLPVFVIKSNTMALMVKAVRMILGMDSLSKQQQPHKSSIDIEIEDDAPKRKPSLEEIDALEEVRLAIEYIVIPGGEAVELLPRPSEIVARQLELVESYRLAALNSGTDLNPRLQILPLKLNKKSSKSSSAPLTGGGDGTGVARLPILPEQ